MALQTALQDRAGGMVSAHAIHRNPEPVGVVDLLVVCVALKPAQGVEDQWLQHGVGHAPRC